MVVILPDLVRLTLSRLPPLQPLVAGLVFVGYVVVTIVNFHSLSVQAATSPLPLPTPRPSAAYQQELSRWLGYYALQPTHRDVLLNLAQLYQILGDRQQAQQFWDQAFHVDPNGVLTLSSTTTNTTELSAKSN